MHPQPDPAKEAWLRLARAGRIPVMVLFSLSVFAILTFLWVSFGGPVPLKANPYQLKVNFPEAATLAEQADVRISGVNIGKVQTMRSEEHTSELQSRQ